jgi:hypothetical protein
VRHSESAESGGVSSAIAAKMAQRNDKKGEIGMYFPE